VANTFGQPGKAQLTRLRKTRASTHQFSTGRIQREPLNLVATIIFFGAIVHTFLAARFRKIAHNYQQSYEAIEYLLHATDGPPDFGKKHDKLLFRAQLFYFMGDVEAVFGVWLIPLFVAIIGFRAWCC